MVGYLNVLLVLTVGFQFVVLSEAEVKEGDVGACLTYISKKAKPILISYKIKRCPAGYKDCTRQEKASLGHFNPKINKCCVKIAMERVPKFTCCKDWQYVKEENICQAQCRPACENGRCVAPNVCECETSLILQNNKCVVPTCDPPCVDGRCVNNNTCECATSLKPINSTHCATICEDGYINDPVSLNCVPVCDKPCHNGTCIAPNTCTCTLGHSLKDDNHTCVPDCTPSCVNSNCVSPNVCFCFDDYKPENDTHCSPICTECANGECVAPNTCKCYEGYSKKDGAVCTADCKEPCGNGICFEPNICKCDLGYKKDPENEFNCLPVCSSKCVNATCVSPNTCSCLIGYEIAGNSWTCKPKCEDCKHGDCIAPNECSCYDGYSVKESNECSPDCEKPCSNGICSGPNVCICKVGFTLDTNDKFSCIPICEPNCVNSTCDSPNTCTCFTGFEPTEESFICKPKCKSCKHGNCVAPDVCRCHDGYKKLGSQCSPSCSDLCVNGQCSSPNICTCDEGYIKNETNPSVCYIPCKGPCANGRCTDGFCNCDSGYTKENDTCVPMAIMECISCIHNCSLGECWCIGDGRPCVVGSGVEAEVTSTTGLAGLELTWTLAGAVGLILVMLMLVVMHRTWRRQKDYGTKATDDCNIYGSVVHYMPNSLIQHNPPEDLDCEHDAGAAHGAREQHDPDTSERLLAPAPTSDTHV